MLSLTGRPNFPTAPDARTVLAGAIGKKPKNTIYVAMQPMAITTAGNPLGSRYKSGQKVTALSSIAFSRSSLAQGAGHLEALLHM
jgi:hypothetical protein